MFASKLNALLEVASGHFRAGCVDDAIEFLEAAVELCEENPAFALKRIEGLGTNLQKVVEIRRFSDPSRDMKLTHRSGC